jgi:membrane fusion protein (multidrug efflux system)
MELIRSWLSIALPATESADLKTIVRLYWKRVLIALGAALLSLGAAHFAYEQWFFESTDDAEIAAHSAVLSAKVGGIVQSVLVDENQVVKAGQVLAKIDNREYQNAVRQAQGEVGSLHARLRDAEKNFHRMQNLYKKGAVSQQQADDAEAAYGDLSKKVQAVDAQVDQAQLNLGYTEIKAPTDGKLGKKSVEPGMVVNPGQALFTFVESNDRWIIANFKETQLRQMKVGQEAEIQIDAIAGKTFTGHVESFSPSSGATFALIPPDNATGNFTKIVQRVPVKIVFDHDSIQGYEDRIVPGISADVDVRTR